MKKVIILLLIFILTGCVSYSDEKITSDLDNYLSDLNVNYNIRINNSTKYFHYYLPSDMQEIAGNENAAVVVYNNSKACINLNVKAIVNSEYYQNSVITDEGFFKEENLLYSNNGTYTKDNDVENHYLLKLYKDNNEFYVYLLTNDVCIYGKTIQEEVVSLVKHFFTVAKSITIEKDAILADYSNKDVIDYQKKQIDLFDYVLPSSGYLTDLVEKDNSLQELNEETNEEGEIEEVMDTEDSSEDEDSE